MLNTLIEIGKQVSEGRHPWEDFLLNIKVRERDAQKNQLILRIVFDLDAGAISVEDGLKLYNPDKRAEYGLIDILKGNNKAIYVAVEPKNLDKLGKAIFGKIESGKGFPELSEFQEAILKEGAGLEKSEFYDALKLIKPHGQAFYEKFIDEKGKPRLNDISIGNQNVLVAVYVAINSAARGWNNKPLAKMEGYREFIEQKFLPSAKENNTKLPRLCYATGDIREDTGEANFSARYNLNKLFQSTTVNYAGNFEKKELVKNYRISEEARQFLDRGSEKVLADFQVNIAGLPHAYIPCLPIGGDYDIEDYKRLRSRTDLIFRVKDITSIVNELDLQTDSGLYWLDFYGFESDGNFLKVTNHIRDVSGAHVERMVKQFKKSSTLLRIFLRDRMVNLGRMYYQIPVRKDLKSNHALELCKMVLEERPVWESLLWQHFSDLVLCHWYGRYKAYANISEPKRDDIIDLLLREAVFSYHAFRHALTNLNLLLMEPNQTIENKKTWAQIEAETQEFLDELGYTNNQHAMFFLGKALKRVVNVQRRDKKNKTALDMVNFNGLDERAIRNMASAILEKGRQYDAKFKLASSLEYDLNRFFQFFPAGENTWNMDSREALFFFLAGYTHFVPMSEGAKAENDPID
jgi:CRISPR-associated protein Csh1